MDFRHRTLVRWLLAQGADPSLRDRPYHGTPAGWARTAMEVTSNPRCEAVALRLEDALRAHRIEDVGME